VQINDVNRRINDQKTMIVLDIWFRFVDRMFARWTVRCFTEVLQDTASTNCKW